MIELPLKKIPAKISDPRNLILFGLPKVKANFIALPS